MATNSEGALMKAQWQVISEKLDSISNRLTDLEAQVGDNWLARENLTGMYTYKDVHIYIHACMEHVTHVTNFYTYIGDCDHEPSSSTGQKGKGSAGQTSVKDAVPLVILR